MQKIFKVEGMTCPHCSERVTKRISSLTGVLEVKVELETGIMTVKYDETVINAQKIATSITTAGYPTSVAE